MRSVLVLLGLALITGQAAAQDTATVMYKDVSCTPEQRATRAEDELARERAPRDELRLPVSRKTLNYSGFRERVGHVAPFWAELSFVVDSADRVDPCTVRIARANNEFWTEFVLKQLPALTYAPGTISGHPSRIFVNQQFMYPQGQNLESPN